MTLSAREVARYLTPLERSVLAAVREVGADPEKVRQWLIGHGMVMARRVEVEETLETLRSRLAAAVGQNGSAERRPLPPKRPLEPDRPEPEPLRSPPVDRRLRMPAPEARPTGKCVTVPAHVTRPPEKEEKMPKPKPFMERIVAEAREEATRLDREVQPHLAAIAEVQHHLEALGRLRMEVHQVRRVLEALDLPVPESLKDVPQDALLVPATSSVAAEVVTEHQERIAELEREVRHATERAELSERHLEEEKVRLRAEADAEAERLRQAQPEAAAAQPEKPPAAKAGTSGPKKAAGAQKAATGHPGIEAVPERLRHLPGAGRRGPLKPRIAALEKMATVLEAVEARETVVAKELAEELPGITQDTIAGYLRDLAAEGLIRRTGRNRLYPAGKPGKAGAEYAPLEKVGKVGKEDFPPVECVRDAVIHLGVGVYSPAQIGEQVERETGKTPNRGVVTARLKELALQGIISDSSVADLVLFEYQTPDKAGRGAELDAARHKELAAAGGNGNGTGGDPVPGTGKRTTGNQAVDQLLREVEKQGGTWVIAGGGHVRVAYGGKTALIPKSPKGNNVGPAKSRLKRVTGIPL